MENRIVWLKKQLEKQSSSERKYFDSYVLGVLKTEAENTPNKTYTVEEVVEILQMVRDARYSN